MKKTAKHTLLFGAFAMLLSTMPMQAMEGLPEGGQEEVTTKQGYFANLGEKARNFRLKNSMKELDRAWRPFIKCVAKGGEDCSKQAQTVRTIIKTILALIGVAGVLGAAGYLRHKFGRGKTAPQPAFSGNDEKLINAVKAYVSKSLTTKENTEPERLVVKNLVKNLNFYTTDGLETALQEYQKKYAGKTTSDPMSKKIKKELKKRRKEGR